MSRNLVTSAGVDTNILRRNEGFSLENYILQNKTIPIGLFGSNTIDAISTAIDYLLNNGGGRVSIPASDSNFPLEIHVHKNRNNVYHINFEYYYDRYPTIESRPYTEEDWQIGDIIYSNNIDISKCVGWVCTEAGTPGKWTAFGWSRNWMSQCEIVDSLPDPSSLQEGRSVITRDETNGRSLLHYCIKNKDGVYEWVNQYFSEEDIINRIEEIISQMSITNADTVDGRHSSDFVNYLGEITDVTNILDNPRYEDCSYEGFISSETAALINLPGESTEWNIKCFRSSEGVGCQIAIPVHYDADQYIPQYRVALKLHVMGSYNIMWSSWRSIADGGNSDTVDGLHADDFPHSHGDTTDCNTATLPGTYNATPDTTNTPYSTYWLVTVETGANGAWIRQTASISDRTKPNEIYCRLFINDKWSDSWVKVNDGGNADTLDGLHATAFYPAKGANTAGIDYDTLVNTGLFEVNGTSTEPTTHSPNGNDSDNNFYVIVYRHSSERCTQVAISTRADKSVYIRARSNSTWGEWTGFFISNNPHITSITSTESTIHLKWLPVANATKYAVSKYNGTGTSYTVLSNNITDTGYTITGLTSGTEYQLLVQAYVYNSWNAVKVENNIIVRTTPVASTSSSGIVTTETQIFGGTKVVTGNLYTQIPTYAVSDGNPSTNQIRAFRVADKNNTAISDFLGWVSTTGVSYGQIRAYAIGDSSKIASISTCIDSNGGNVRHVCSSPSNPYTTSLRQLASGTSDVNKDVCPTGAWYGKYE